MSSLCLQILGEKLTAVKFSEAAMFRLHFHFLDRLNTFASSLKLRSFRASSNSQVDTSIPSKRLTLDLFPQYPWTGVLHTGYRRKMRREVKGGAPTGFDRIGLAVGDPSIDRHRVASSPTYVRHAFRGQIDGSISHPHAD